MTVRKPDLGEVARGESSGEEATAKGSFSSNEDLLGARGVRGGGAPVPSAINLRFFQKLRGQESEYTILVTGLSVFCP